MPRHNKSHPWQFDPYDSYSPITYEGIGVGFCKLDFADRIVEVLNEDEKLRQALKMACSDLIRQSGGDPNQVDELVKKYIEKTEHPKYGSGAIAYLLRDRQEELDMSDREFSRFCESYKLSPQELKDIYEGKDVSNSQLGVLARILRKSTEELIKLWNGFTELEDDIRTKKTEPDGSFSRKQESKAQLFTLRQTHVSKGKITGADAD